MVNTGGVVQASRADQWGAEGRGPDLHGRDLARVGGARPLWEPPGRRCSGQQPPPAPLPLPPALAAPRVPTSGRLRLPPPTPFLRPPAPGRVWGARPFPPGSKEGGPFLQWCGQSPASVILRETPPLSSLWALSETPSALRSGTHPLSRLCQPPRSSSPPPSLFGAPPPPSLRRRPLPLPHPPPPSPAPPTMRMMAAGAVHGLFTASAAPQPPPPPPPPPPPQPQPPQQPSPPPQQPPPPPPQPPQQQQPPPQAPPMESEAPDSRKRPLETPPEVVCTKRSNTGGEKGLRLVVGERAGGLAFLHPPTPPNGRCKGSGEGKDAPP